MAIEKFNNPFEETDSIIGKIPVKIVRRGNISIFVILFLVIILGLFLPYKDTVKAPLSLTTVGGMVKCKAMVRSADFGKVKKGQEVLVTLDVYPRNEFGYLKGVIRTVGNRFHDGGYDIGIALHSLTLSYNDTVRLLPEMTGSAEIIISREPFAYKLFPFLNTIVKRKQ